MKPRGVVLFELLMVLVLLMSLFGIHLAMIRYWRIELQDLQKKRIRYDGVMKWENSLKLLKRDEERGLTLPL